MRPHAPEPGAACGPPRWHHHRHHRRRDRRLFWRVYLHGIMLLVLAAVTAVVTGSIARAMPSWQRIEERVGGYVASELAPLTSNLGALDAKLQRWHDIFDVDASVYTREGVRIAAAGNEPPEAFDTPPERGESTRRHHVRGYDLDGDHYLVVRAFTPFYFGRGALVVAAVLLVLALASAPLARAITRPLERLTATARAFGRGDLSARTGLVRRDEVGDLARAFDDMAERVERLVVSEKELLANVSHELRTPMARIRIALELCEEPDSDAAALRQHLSGIGQDLAELERLVSDVLTAARLDAGTAAFPLRRELVDLAGILQQAAQRFARAHPEQALDTAALDAGTLDDALIDGDPVLLRRVTDNLLDNAAKFSDPGAGPIELGVTGEDGAIRVEVRDRGIGVAEEDVARLFDPFFRTDRSRDRGTGGVGLGLHLCRRIVEAHGGTIGAACRPDGGLVVHFTLPSASGTPPSNAVSPSGFTSRRAPRPSAR